MKYLLFVGDSYYPEGGCNDFFGTFPSIDDAKKAASGDWAHVAVYDGDKLKIVSRMTTSWNRERGDFKIWKDYEC